MSEASIQSVFQLAIGSGDIVSGVFFARKEDAERAARLWNLSCKAHKGGQIPVEVIENTLAKTSTEGLRDLVQRGRDSGFYLLGGWE